MIRRFALLVLVLAPALLASPRPTDAIFHIAAISEVMSGFAGDPAVQYVEVRMDFEGQHIVHDTVASVFDEDGTPALNELMILPTDVPNDGDDVRWLMATQAFADLTGLQPDFIIPPDVLPDKGMFCWGAPDFAPPPDAWDHTLPFFYTDCVSYGGYAGPPVATHAPATPLTAGDGTKALQRIFPLPVTPSGSPTEAYELYCAPPAPAPPPGATSAQHLGAPPDADALFLCCPTPENNAGQVALLGADGDADGLPDCHELEVGTVNGEADTDGDGCLDGAEVANGAARGGLRDPTNFWDLYDTPNDSNVRDAIVDTGDVFRVVQRFGATGDPGIDPLSAAPASGYHTAFDRSPVAGKLSGPADGAIDVGDIFLSVAQFGHSCA